MTELQTSLIAIGSVIVIGVISYNKWQEWRAKRSVESAFSSLQEDVLMGASARRREPVLTNDEDPSATDADDSASKTEEAAHREMLVVDSDEADNAEYAELAQPETPQFIEAVLKPSPLDASIDCIIAVFLDTPQRGEKLSTLFQGLRLVGNKSVQLIGQSETGQWETVAHGGAYHELQIGVQLATRSGPLTELEYSELVTGLNQLADELGAQPELPDMSQVMADARRLHQLILEFDAQLSVNVQARSAPWMVSTLRPALQRQGLELRPDGRLVMPDGDGGMLFSLLTNGSQSDDTSKLMTFLLPVPLVAPERNGFAAMTAFAKAMAARLSGVVVDDSGQPLSEQAMAEIAAQVQSFYQAMEQAGVAAGSVRAQRLFG